jgi:IgGFc binding protein/Bacterial Ig-like domain (group 1)
VRQRLGAILSALAVLLSVLTATGFMAVTSASPAAAATPPQTSQGTDFWVTFESNCTINGCGSPSGPGNLYLFISGATATTGTVSDPGISFTQSFSVTPGAVTTIQVPSTAEDDATDTVVPAGIHITAGAPVSAYGLNTLEYTTDGYLGLPTGILGTSYLVEGYGGGFGSQFAVVGTADGTTVTITPSESVDSYTAGTPYTVTLNAGQVYQLVDEAGGDLSGTAITSSSPVAVFAGNDCADVPPTDSACNTLTEEMTPTDTWGTDFLTEPLATRSGDTFRFMASENNTTVEVNGTSVATLNAGQFYETILTAASEVTANNPIQVMQYSNGSSYDGANADPFDITVAPDGQFLNSYTVTTEPQGADPAITSNYINVVAPTSEVGSVTLDGTDIPSSDFTPIAGSAFSGAQVPVPFGSHVLNGPLPFGITVYGFGGYDGYGYPGGFTLSPIATVSQVSVSSGTEPVGSQGCPVATVTDQNGNPVDGVRVDFTVTGANPTTGFAYTGSNGQAQFCYTGAASGNDTVVGAVQSIQSPPATWVWTKTPTTLATTLSGNELTGTAITVPAGTAVTDTATLTGANTATATGTVSYNLYSDSACTDLVAAAGGGAVTAGSVPGSSAETLSNPGTYYWTASYSGDGANQPSSSGCGAETVTVPPTAETTTLSTSLSGGGASGPSITVPSGTAVTDAATLSGTNASSATGTVTYNVYSDSACSTLVNAGTPEPITTPGTLPAASAVTLSAPGTFYWQASYSGDTNNDASTSTCGAAGEVETVTGAKTRPTPTTLRTLLSGTGKVNGVKCWWRGSLITVFAGASVTDTATLNGANAANATGTVTYTVYALVRVSRFPFWRWEPVADGGTVAVTAGLVPPSKAVTLPAGTYEWQASYSGDSRNDPSASRFGSETEIVIPVPQCKYGWNPGFNPFCKLRP